MAERSFAKEVLKLRAGAGEVVEAEGILAVTKALLESGVAYVGGYQGAPISHLMDVLADAQDILTEQGRVIMQRVLKAASRVFHQAFASFQSDEIRALNAQLSRVHRALEEPL